MDSLRCKTFFLEELDHAVGAVIDVSLGGP